MSEENSPGPAQGARRGRRRRRFLAEYVIVFVGVLTALAAEQGAQWVHTRNEVRLARQALQAELTANASISRNHAEEDRCLGPQLDAFEAWALSGGPRPSIVRASFSPLASSTWDVVKAGAAAQMPLKERLAYANFYDGIANQRWVLENERAVFLRLGGLQQNASLDGAQAQRLIEDVGQARVLVRVRMGNAEIMVKRAKALGVEPTPLTAAGRRRIDWQCGRAATPTV